MKRKVIFTCTLCFLLCVCGCTPRTAGEIRRTDEESQADANAAGVVQGDSLKTPVEMKLQSGQLRRKSERPLQ